MQIFRTNRAQNLGPRSEELPETQNADPELQNTVNDFFNQEAAAEEPVLPTSPFDLLFVGTPPAPGTEAANGSPSTSQFAPARVVTLEQWLMAYPEGIHALNLYKEKMEQILQTRFIDRRDGFQQLLQNGGMRPNEISVIQQVIADIDASIVIMRREIEKAENKIQEQGQIFFRERSAMQDLNNDGFIGDPNSDDFYKIATHPNGDVVILDKNNHIAVNPYLDPNYKPALTDTESVRLIERERHGVQPIGASQWTFDETFEIAGFRPEGWSNHTFGAQIDVTVPEGFWVEADAEGNPVVEWDELGSESVLKPKPFEVITREDGKERYGQNPPSDDERDRWVFVKVTDLEIKSEDISHLEDADGNPVDGGFVHYQFSGVVDGQLVTVMRMRFQGVESRSANPLVSDGSNYIAATTVGIAVNAGDKTTDEEGNEIMVPHSSRISPININAQGYTSTGKVISTDNYRNEDFLNTLGLPADFSGGLDRLSDEQENENIHSDKDRATMAAADTLESFSLTSVLPEEIANRIGGLATYIPKDTNNHTYGYDAYKTGLFAKNLRGVIRGTGYNDIITVPPPNEEAIRNMLPPGAEEIDPSNPAYGTYVDAGSGKNIVVSKGGDIYAKNATFFWREASPGSRRGDMIYLDVAEVNKSGEHNNRIFVHIGDQSPEVVAIAMGIDQDEDDEAREADDRDIPPEKMDTEVSSQNDDWQEGPAFERDIVRNDVRANDIFGGIDYGIYEEGLRDQIQTASADAYDEILTKVIRLDPVNDFEFNPDGWDIPEFVQDEDANADAFFAEWEFFSDQEPDMNPETLQNE
ncbi:MAG: hypothetical protein HY609_03540 [Deltaproteobacteria bacterium]|nr:hypothetical protein [Deltaproteobacteria bacterium]MBI4223982.1 hypothetical protein [Deltaproteobacteria bacterium]